MSKSKFVLAVFAALMASSGVSQAQFGNSTSLHFWMNQPSYSVEVMANNREALAKQLNAQGASGGLFGLAAAFGVSPGPIGVFMRDSSDFGKIFSYSVLPYAPSEAESLAQLNEQGAMGFRYVGPYSVGEMVNLYIRVDGVNVRYECLFDSSVNSQVAFEARLNEFGHQGWRWIGPILTVPFDVKSQRELYLREFQTTTRYNYRVSNTLSDEGGMEALLNTQGSDGHRWIGSTMVGAVFEQRSDDTRARYYVMASSTATSGAFIDQADSQGDAGRIFQTFVYFDGIGGGIRNLYVGMAPLSESERIGIRLLDASALELSFVPNAVGLYLLSTSHDLSNWIPSGSTQSGSAGAPINWLTSQGTNAVACFKVERVLGATEERYPGLQR